MRGAIITFVSALLLAGCAGNGTDERPLTARQIADRLVEHARTLDPELSQTEMLGEVIAAECSPTDKKHRDQPLFICDVYHAGVGGAIAEWCAAFVDGEIVTSREDQGVPCLTREGSIK